MKNKSTFSLYLYYCIIFVLSTIFLSSCASSSNSIMRAFYNMANCQYEYNEIKNIQLGNIKINSGVSISNMPKVISYLSENKTNKILKFDINISIENMSNSVAKFSEMEYIVIIDNIEFDSGIIKESIVIPPNVGSITKFNISTKTNLDVLKSKYPSENIDDIAKAILGFQKHKANVTVFLAPSIVNDGKRYKSPIPVEINFPIGK